MTKDAIRKSSSKQHCSFGGVDKTGSKDEKVHAVLSVTFAPAFKCSYTRQLEIAVVGVYNTKELTIVSAGGYSC